MNNSSRFSGGYIGALVGAVSALILWIIPHSPYTFSVALGISCLPLALGFLGNYLQQKYFSK